MCRVSIVAAAVVVVVVVVIIVVVVVVVVVVVGVSHKAATVATVECLYVRKRDVTMQLRVA